VRPLASCGRGQDELRGETRDRGRQRGGVAARGRGRQRGGAAAPGRGRRRAIDRLAQRFDD
jgi:hypothetical protein